MPTRVRLDPRKRPRQQRAAATVAAILEAAAHILERDGLAGFNTNAIAARAGASIGSLYQYFPNKNALLAALIRADTEAFLAALTVAAEAEDPIDAMIAVAIAHQRDAPRRARILDMETARLPLDAETAASAGAIAALIAGVLSRRDPHLSPEVPGDLLAIARGLIDSAGPETDPADLARRVRRAIAGYLAN